LGFFFRIGLLVEGEAAGAAAGGGACGVEAAMLNLGLPVAGAEAGSSGAAGTTRSVWQDGQLIWWPEYSEVAAIFCWQ
jgi:hypothetical protein